VQLHIWVSGRPGLIGRGDIDAPATALLQPRAVGAIMSFK
jgi:hypothetical protein